MKKVLSLIVLVTLILVMAACGLTAKQSGSKKSSGSAVAPATYSLSVSPNTPHGGSVTILPQQEQYISGSTVSLTAIQKASWVFDKWLCEGDSSIHESRTNPLLITMDKNKKVIARFAPTTSTIKAWDLTILPCKYDPGNGHPGNPDYGTVSKSPDYSLYVADQDEVTLTAIPKGSRVFKGWQQTLGSAVTVVSGALDNDNFPTIKIKMNISNSVTLRATFQ